MTEIYNPKSGHNLCKALASHSLQSLQTKKIYRSFVNIDKQIYSTQFKEFTTAICLLLDFSQNGVAVFVS